MPVYFGVPLAKTEPIHEHYRVCFGEQRVFILEGQFPGCDEFLGWYGDLTFNFMGEHFVSPSIFLPNLPPRLERRQTDDIYLVLARCWQGGSPSVIIKPEDQRSEVCSFYKQIRRARQDILFYDIIVLKAQKDDMFCYVEPDTVTLYYVSENGVELFSSNSFDGLRERVLGEKVVPSIERLEYYLNFDCWRWDYVEFCGPASAM